MSDTIITRVGETRIPAEADYYGTRTSLIEQANAALAETWEWARDLLHTMGCPRESMTMPEFHGGNEWRIYGDSHRGRLFVSVYDRAASGPHGGPCCGHHDSVCDLPAGCRICPTF